MANPTKSKPVKKNETKLITKAYLILYNLIQVVGWTYLLHQLVTYYILPSESEQNLYDTVKWTLIIFQNAAVLEIVHAMTGMVKSNVMVTVMQVYSRVMVVCGVLMATPTGQNSPGLPLALGAWAVTEIIRYSYYAMNLVNFVPSFLIWLRYTLFIVLYPIGVTGELLCFYSAQQYVFENQMWTISLPNILNVTFNYHYLLLFVMALYVPLFPQLYLHMFSQRKKFIGGGQPTPKAASQPATVSKGNKKLKSK